MWVWFGFLRLAFLCTERLDSHPSMGMVLLTLYSRCDDRGLADFSTFLINYLEFLIYLFHVYEYLATVHALGVPGGCGGQRRVWNSLELELQVVVSRCV